jgi:hypothetical protein
MNKPELETQLQEKINTRKKLESEIFEVQKHISKKNFEFNERKIATQARITACSQSRPPQFDQSVSWPQVPREQCQNEYAQFFSNKEMLERDLWREMEHIKEKHVEAVEIPKIEEHNLQLQINTLTQEINSLFSQIKKIPKKVSMKTRQTRNKLQKPCPLSKKKYL